MQEKGRQKAGLKFKGMSTDIVPAYTVSMAGMDLPE
jgi:hypothetical protein